MARPRLDRPNFRLVRRGGRYYVRWWENGDWRRVSTGTDDRQAAGQYLAQFAAGFGMPLPPEQPTIAAILDGYLEDRKERVAAYDTLKFACAALRRHLGDLMPEHLTKGAGRLYAARRRAEGHMVGKADARRKKTTGDGTILRELVTLRAALRWAARGTPDERWIADAPHIEVPASPRARDRWLSREEAARLLAECKADHVRLFVALALYTGARSAAILGLQWAAVDLEGGLIDLGAGSGNKRRAVVPIAAPLLPLLRQARAAATCDYVVQHGDARVDSIKTGFGAACRRAKLAAVTPHVLRHTAATWLAIAGRPMDEIARYLGNRLEMVERVYAKHSPDYLRAAAAALSGPVDPETPVDKVS